MNIWETVISFNNLFFKLIRQHESDDAFVTLTCKMTWFVTLFQGWGITRLVRLFQGLVLWDVARYPDGVKGDSLIIHYIGLAEWSSARHEKSEATSANNVTLPRWTRLDFGTQQECIKFDYIPSTNEQQLFCLKFNLIFILLITIIIN